MEEAEKMEKQKGKGVRQRLPFLGNKEAVVLFRNYCYSPSIKKEQENSSPWTLYFLERNARNYKETCTTWWQQSEIG